MDKENKEGFGLGDLGVLLIVVGIYLFLAQQIRARATKLLTVVLGSLVAASVTIWGAIALANLLKGGKSWDVMPGVYVFLVLSAVFYVLLLVKAIRENRAACSDADDEDLSVWQARLEEYRRNHAPEVPKDQPAPQRVNTRSITTTWDYK